MLIYAVDDEPLALRSLSRAIREAEPDCQVREFAWGQPMLDALAASDERPDAAFVDIEMPGLSGIEVAKRLRQLSPRTWVIFVTGFSEFAVDAFSIHAKGYVMKPVSAQDIRAELNAPAPPPLPAREKRRVRVRTFGNFEVYVDGEPLDFPRRKAKEMLAYLVHQGGAACSTQELVSVLFEERNVGKLDYFYKVVQCLKRTLNGVGCGDILRHSYKTYAIDTDLIDCDRYRFPPEAMPPRPTDRSPERAGEYAGEYMAQYSWAESANAYFSKKTPSPRGTEENP